MQKVIEIYIDGASRGNPGPAGVGIYIRYHQGKDLVKKGEFIGETTNNVAEYEGLRRALRWINKNHLSRNCALKVYTDSELLVKQMSGDYRIRSQNLMSLAIETRNLMKKFRSVEFKMITRKDNKIADKLANKSMNLMSDVDEMVGL